MSTYKLLVRTISAENKAYNNGAVSDEEYTAWKENTLKKMDTFLVCRRISNEQYKELDAMFKL